MCQPHTVSTSSHVCKHERTTHFHCLQCVCGSLREPDEKAKCSVCNRLACSRTGEPRGELEPGELEPKQAQVLGGNSNQIIPTFTYARVCVYAAVPHKLSSIAGRTHRTLKGWRPLKGQCTRSHGLDGPGHSHLSKHTCLSLTASPRALATPWSFASSSILRWRRAVAAESAFAWPRFLSATRRERS